MAFNTGQFRDVTTDITDGGGANPYPQDPRELPIEVSREVIQVAVQNSNLLQLARVQPMPTRQSIAPVLTQYPTAYWLSGANQKVKESALKQTTSVDWSTVSLRAEELAVMIPIPDAYVQDTGVDLFNELKPLLGAAFGKAIDQAAFFDVLNPWSTSGGIFQQAVAKGNYVDLTTTTSNGTNDIALDLGQMGSVLETQGFDLNGYSTGPAFRWRLINTRTTQGVPVYAPPADKQPATIFGEQLAAVKNGSWDNTKALAIAGDWEFARVGIRQDMTFSISDSAVITDGTNVTYNAFQQDGKVLRAVMRIAFAVVAPAITPVSANPYPFVVLRPTTPHLNS